MNIEKALRTGVKILGIASVAFVPGCKSGIEPTSATPVGVSSTPTASPEEFPAYVKGCSPVEVAGGVIKLDDGREQVSTGKRSVVLEEETSGNSRSFKAFYPGQIVPPGHGTLYKCQRK